MSEPALTKTTAAAAYGGSAGAILGGMTANDFALFVGAAVAVLGLLGNWWFQWRRDKRESMAVCAECPHKGKDSA